eukprot:COSAG01_NODE_1134_length_11558_cov_8.381360_7_plen_123_part_00
MRLPRGPRRLALAVGGGMIRAADTTERNNGARHVVVGQFWELAVSSIQVRVQIMGLLMIRTGVGRRSHRATRARDRARSGAGYGITALVDRRRGAIAATAASAACDVWAALGADHSSWRGFQ